MDPEEYRFAAALITANPPHPNGVRLHNRAAELLSDRNVSPVCPEVLYRYLPFGVQPDGGDITDRTLQMIRDGAFWFSPPKQLNDPCEMAFVESNRELEAAGPSALIPLSREVAENREKCRVCCFSGDWNQGPMWAHYAGGQSGICIGFRTEHLKDSFFKINYEVRDLSEFQGRRGLLLAMTTKTKDWEYENEWRLIYPWSIFDQPANDGEIGGCHQHLDCRVHELIFGQEVPDSEIAKISEIASAFDDVTIYRLAVGSSIERKRWSRIAT